MKNFFLLLLLIFFLSITISAQEIIDRGPYLQMATSNSMVIKWRTEDPTESIVWYGITADNLNLSVQSAGTTTEHEVHLSGLNSNSYYYYAVGNDAGVLKGGTADFRFKTNPPIGADVPFTAWVQGDPGTGNDAQRATRDGYYTYLGDKEMDLMLVLGDNAYSDGKQGEFQDAFFEDMYEDLINKIVVWPTLGNHDGHSADSEEQSGPYYDIFTLPKNGEAGGTASGTEAFYSYDYANAHFVVLNSVDLDRTSTGAMALWLEQDLANTNQDWIVAYFHHPIYSGANDNESDDGNEEVEMRENILPILEAHDVDLVLFGDTHNYQRSFLLKNHYGISSTFDPLSMAMDSGTGRLADDSPYTKLNQYGGAVFVVAGSSGKLEGEDEEDLNHPTTVVGYDKMGSLSLEINGAQLDCKFVLQDGSVADHFTILKAVNPLSIEITNPIDNSYYSDLQNINITAAASDTNGGVTQVEFYINGVLISTDYNSPYSLNWHPLHAGNYTIKATATDTDGFTKSSTKNIQVGQTTSSCARVIQSEDDAEQRPNGSINFTSGDLELIEDGSDDQIVGIRFTNLNIPRGAAITEAFLDFTVKNTAGEDPCQLHIYGQTGTNLVPFSSNSHNISNRPKTSNSVNWNPSDWNNTNETHSSSNIASVLQEIVLQNSYNTNDPIVIIIEGVGSRVAYSFDGDEDKAPQLCISFDADNCLDSDFDGVCDIDDLCQGTPDPGQACNDNYSGTYNDIIQADCSCEGTLYNCPDLAAQYGSICNDNNVNTFDDIVTQNCICAGTPYDCPLLQLQFGTPCNDNNPDTFDDLITANCECLGTPYDCPDLQLQFGTPCNDNNPFTCYDVITTDCECAGTATNGFTNLSSIINQDSDDAEEKPSGSVSIGSSDLELVVDGSNVQKIGLRFSNPGIEAGTTVSSAFLQFTVDETNNDNPCSFTIYGELGTNAATFAATELNISNRVKTTASITWSPNEWTTVGDRGADQQSPNLAAIIQEIVNLSGYTSGTPFAFIIEGQGRRVAMSHDGNSSGAAGLTVSYGSTLADADGDGVCDDEDQCSGPEPGSPCNDNNSLTYNDIINDNCLCEGTPFDCPALVLNIGNTCNDGNPATYNDIVTSNCDCAGTLFECPDLAANIGDPCDDGDISTNGDEIGSDCTCIGDPPVLVEICNQINEDSDDAEERPGGQVNTTSSDLELVNDNSNIQLVGLRFAGLNLNQGTAISTAHIQFTVDKGNNINPCILEIKGELAPNPMTFEQGANNDISNRASTIASVSWSPEEWINVGESGILQQSADISSIIQEIVNQVGFGPQSAVVLTISGEGLRQAISHDEDPGGAAILCVNALMPQTQAMTINDLGKDPQFHILKTTETSEPESRNKQNQLSSDLDYLKVYPNPAKAAITASFDVPFEGQVYLNILDINGKLLYKQKTTVISGQNKLLLDTTDLPNGVYFLTLQTDKERRIAKFSIIK